MPLSIYMQFTLAGWQRLLLDRNTDIFRGNGPPTRLHDDSSYRKRFHRRDQIRESQSGASTSLTSVIRSC